jgi:hypothetical protein
VRYASLQKLFPAEAERLHAQLSKEMAQRYERLQRLAAYTPAEPQVDGAAAPAAGEDTSKPDVCTLSSTAEHGGDEACDDGRAGK